MNRKYTRASYIDRIERLRAVRPDIAVSSDMIVGFPGETDEDFDQTLDLVETIGYDGLFAFIYSDRPHAPAVKFPDKVPEDVKKKRLETLLRLEKTLSQMRNDAYLDRVEAVLVEGQSKKSGDEGPVQWSGRSSSNKVVNFIASDEPEDTDMTGRIVDVRIDRCLPHSLCGKLIRGF
jgi:tRNA-2-methylthio-N6-dimethylallyladenosine synthase